jgi:hypothetical protein
MSNTKFSFTDRISYIAFRAAWKIDYKQISQQIREAKLAFKNSERAASAGGTWPKNQEGWKAMWANQRALKALQVEANQMINDLHEAKQYAAQLRAERLATA